VAVASALGLGPEAAAAGLTADNVMALAYFPLCNALGHGARDPPPLGAGPSGAGLSGAAAPGRVGALVGAPGGSVPAGAAPEAGAGGMLTALALASALVAGGEKLFPGFGVVSLCRACNFVKFRVLRAL